jgi:hypothetical protein
MNDPTIWKIEKSFFGRWIIVSAARPDLAWSGSQWVPHRHGIPTGGAQVSNFASREEAEDYTDQYFSAIYPAPTE